MSNESESNLTEKPQLMLWATKNHRKQEFEELLLENMNTLYNVGYRLTLNHEEAKDLVQETSLRAYRFFHKFEQGTNFRGWACTILRNIFINQYRKKKKEPHKVDYDAVQSFVEVPQISGAEEEIFGESVQTSIDALPEDMRTAITLFYVEGFAYKEIARIMDCPIGTVMSRLHMARQLLKKKLSKMVKSTL